MTMIAVADYAPLSAIEIIRALVAKATWVDKAIRDKLSADTTKTNEIIEALTDNSNSFGLRLNIQNGQITSIDTTDYNSAYNIKNKKAAEFDSANALAATLVTQTAAHDVIQVKETITEAFAEKKNINNVTVNESATNGYEGTFFDVTVTHNDFSTSQFVIESSLMAIMAPIHANYAAVMADKPCPHKEPINQLSSLVLKLYKQAPKIAEAPEASAKRVAAQKLADDKLLAEAAKIKDERAKRLEKALTAQKLTAEQELKSHISLHLDGNYTRGGQQYTILIDQKGPTAATDTHAPAKEDPREITFNIDATPPTATVGLSIQDEAGRHISKDDPVTITIPLPKLANKDKGFLTYGFEIHEHLQLECAKALKGRGYTAQPAVPSSVAKTAVPESTLTPLTDANLLEAINTAAVKYNAFSNALSFNLTHFAAGRTHVNTLVTACTDKDLAGMLSALKTFFNKRADGTNPGIKDHSFVSFLLDALAKLDLTSLGITLGKKYGASYTLTDSAYPDMNKKYHTPNLDARKTFIAAIKDATLQEAVVSNPLNNTGTSGAASTSATGVNQVDEIEQLRNDPKTKSLFTKAEAPSTSANHLVKGTGRSAAIAIPTRQNGADGPTNGYNSQASSFEIKASLADSLRSNTSQLSLD